MEERLIRLEDMLKQLIDMVGEVIASQNEMLEDMRAWRSERNAGYRITNHSNQLPPLQSH